MRDTLAFVMRFFEFAALTWPATAFVMYACAMMLSFDPLTSMLLGAALGTATSLILASAVLLFKPSFYTKEFW